MEEGFVKSDGAYVGMQKWGKKVNWIGLMKDGAGVKTLKCKKCGYLESYAK